MRYFLFVAFLLLRIVSTAQETVPGSTEEIKQEYARRVKLEKIDGQYIPKDIDDAYREFQRITDDSSRAKFARMTEDDARTKLYYSLGQWFKVKWSLKMGSRLAEYFHQNGITWPDDMVAILTLYFHRKLNNKDPQLADLFKYYKEKRAAAWEEYIKKHATDTLDVVKPMDSTKTKKPVTPARKPAPAGKTSAVPPKSKK